MILNIVLGVISVLLIVILAYSWKLGREKRLDVSEEEAFKRLVSNATKPINIDGVPFVIRKIQVLDYLEGAKVLAEIFSTYKNQKANDTKTIEQIDTNNLNKAKTYITDIICAGCVRPKFCRKAPEEGSNEIHIEEVFSDWVLAQKLAMEIFEFTQGKKK